MVTYPLTEILFVLFVGQLCGMNDVDESVLFAETQMGWLRGFYVFENGVAPAQTIRHSFHSHIAMLCSWHITVAIVCGHSFHSHIAMLC